MNARTISDDDIIVDPDHMADFERLAAGDRQLDEWYARRSRLWRIGEWVVLGGCAVLLLIILLTQHIRGGTPVVVVGVVVGVGLLWTLRLTRGAILERRYRRRKNDNARIRDERHGDWWLHGSVLYGFAVNESVPPHVVWSAAQELWLTSDTLGRLVELSNIVNLSPEQEVEELILRDQLSAVRRRVGTMLNPDNVPGQ